MCSINYDLSTCIGKSYLFWTSFAFLKTCNKNLLYQCQYPSKKVTRLERPQSLVYTIIDNTKNISFPSQYFVFNGWWTFDAFFIFSKWFIPQFVINLLISYNYLKNLNCMLCLTFHSSVNKGRSDFDL